MDMYSAWTECKQMLVKTLPWVQTTLWTVINQIKHAVVIYKTDNRSKVHQLYVLNDLNSSVSAKHIILAWNLCAITMTVFFYFKRINISWHCHAPLMKQNQVTPFVLGKKLNNGLQAQTHVTQQNRYFRRERMIEKDVLLSSEKNPDMA